MCLKNYNNFEFILKTPSFVPWVDLFKFPKSSINLYYDPLFSSDLFV